MTWPVTLVLVRHAESEGNILTVDERATFNVATHAYALTPHGQEQAKITGEYLQKRFGKFDAYYTSYYRRARETMQLMYPSAKIWEDSRLSEGQRGIYHTMTHAEIAAKFPEELKRKDRENLFHYRPPGGENWMDIEIRIHSFLGSLKEDCANKKVLIVVHGQWMVLLQKILDKFSIDEALRRYKEEVVDNASVTVYQQEVLIPQFGSHPAKTQFGLLAGKENYNFCPWKSESNQQPV